MSIVAPEPWRIDLHFDDIDFNPLLKCDRKVSIEIVAVVEEWHLDDDGVRVIDKARLESAVWKQNNV